MRQLLLSDGVSRLLLSDGSSVLLLRPLGGYRSLPGFWLGGLSAAPIVTVSFTVEDNGDGTVTVTIEGTTGTNTVYYCLLNDPYPDPIKWRSGGTRNGDGDVVVVMPSRGPWFFTVANRTTTTTAITTSIINNDDGTATVTILGSQAGSANVVYYRKVDATWPDGPLGWTNGGNRTGNGAVNISPGAGQFYVVVKSGSVDISTPKYVVVTDDAPAILSQIVDAVHARLILLGLDGIDADRIFKQVTPLDAKFIREVNENALIVAPYGAEQWNNREGSVNKDWIGEPIAIIYAGPANKSHADEDRDRWFLWREKIRKAFINQWLLIASGQALPGILDPMDIVVPGWWEKNAIVGSQGFRFVSRESRGINA